MKKPVVWAKMIYVCGDCGSKFRIFIENTLERPIGDKHKPVPFGIRCPNCKNFHCFDRSGLIELPEERPVKTGELYFADKKKYDCGVVRIYEN